jgi:serine/threonine protein kinase
MFSPQLCVMTPMMFAPSSRNGDLRVSDICIGDCPINPTDRAFQQQLLSKLGVDQRCTIEGLQGCGGARNEGVFILKSNGEELVLKLVKSQGLLPGLPTEAESLLELSRTHPTIGNDAALAFPRHIIRLLGSCQECRYEIIVMPKAPGRALCNVITDRWRTGRVAEVMGILEQVGECLRGFHQRYGGKQHCDLTPSNVLFDEASGRVSFIDLGGMGSNTSETDISYFSKCLRSSAQFLDPQLETQGLQHFQRGYEKGQVKRIASVGSPLSPSTTFSSVRSPLSSATPRVVSVGSPCSSPCQSPRDISSCLSRLVLRPALPISWGKPGFHGSYVASSFSQKVMAPYPALLISQRR